MSRVGANVVGGGTVLLGGVEGDGSSHNGQRASTEANPPTCIGFLTKVVTCRDPWTDHIR